MTAALWTGARAWLLGAALYLPQTWIDDPSRRAVAQIPPSAAFQEKWRQALTLIRRARGAGLAVTAVAADAEFGDVAAFRLVDSTTTAVNVRDLALSVPATRWRRVAWRNGTHRPFAARFLALRVTPATEWRERRVAPEVWLLCEQDLGATPRIKFFLINLPATATLSALVRLAHQRWAIEQQYQELKTELGLDHFEGRSWPGWHRHVVLTALADAFIQQERMRRDADPALTFPGTRAFVTELVTALFLAQTPRYLRRIQELAEIHLRI